MKIEDQPLNQVLDLRRINATQVKKISLQKHSEIKDLPNVINKFMSNDLARFTFVLIKH